MISESYTPRVWRTHPLHVCPPEPYLPGDPLTKATLDWIFIISSLNFSFWSEKDEPHRYAVEWRQGWHSDKEEIWTGYWSLVAALNRGEIPFYCHIKDIRPKKVTPLPSARGGHSDHRSSILLVRVALS